MPTPGVRIARVVVLILAALFLVGAAFALLVVFTLLFPGTVVDGIWAMKAGSRAPFVALGGWGILLLVLLAAALGVTAVGLVRRWRWARWVAVILLAANVLPDIPRALTADPASFLPVLPVAVVLVYLTLPVVGRSFRRPTASARIDG